MNLLKWLAFIRSYNVLVLTLLLYSFVGIGVVQSSQRCGSILDSPGWTMPHGDIELKEGDNLTTYCVLDELEAKEKGLSSSQLYFNFKNQRVPSENVTILNDTAVVLQLNNLSITSDWLYCRANVKVYAQSEGSVSLEVPTENNDTFICANMVMVGTQPKDIVNFTCYSYDWKELNCTWEEPYNEIPTRYYLVYSLPKRGGRNQFYECRTYEDLGKVTEPGKEERKIKRCSWSVNAEPPTYRNNFEYLTFNFTGVNKIGEHTQLIKFHNYAHIIPSAPRQLEAIEKTESSVRLRWAIDSLITFDKGWYYRVNYTMRNHGGWNYFDVHQKDKTLEKNKDVLTLNVTGLEYPNTFYNFRVSMRSSVAPQNEGWSEAAHIIVKTKPTRPYRAPKTERGSFEISSSESKDDYRVVYVYWQQLSRLEYNGDNFTYDITVFKDGVLSPDTQQLVLVEAYAKYKIYFHHYRFEIRSRNSEGVSENASIVDIPDKEHTLKPLTILSKTDYGDGVYELSWKAVEGVRDVNYTLFWCESDREYPYQCNGYVDWKLALGNLNKMNFTNKNYVKGHQSVVYQFAVSASSANFSSGMTWASCTIFHDTVNKINSVWVDKIDSYSILMRWKLECSNRVDGVKGYYIYYCALEEQDQNKCSKDKEKTMTVYGDLDMDQALVTGLEPSKNYQLSIAMFTSNITGPRSEPLVNRTLDGPPNVTDIDFVSTAATNTSIALQWKPINKTNGVLQRYLISYDNNKTEVPANVTSVVLGHLVSYQQYEIKLRACTILCSDEVGPLKVTTKIGKPGNIENLSSQNLNATHMVAEWSKLAIPGGPHPVFKIRITYNDTNKVIEDWEVTRNNTVLDKEICTYGEPSIQVRAINRDEKNNQTYEGEWSKTLKLTCPYSQGSTVLRIMFAVAMLLVIASITVTWGRKGFYRCQEMKNVTVTLPGPLTVAPYTKDSVTMYESFSLHPTKSVDEIHTLVGRTTELSLFSSQP